MLKENAKIFGSDLETLDILFIDFLFFRHKDEEKESASEEFIKIKEAYEKLSTIKKERAWKNKRSEEL